MAAPHVAGTAALLKSLNKSLRPADIANIIRSTATPVSGCATGICGSGIRDAAAAVAKADDESTIAPQSTYPAFAALPIAGTAAVGGTLTAQFQNGYPGITYQWYLDGSPISHATSSTYPVAASDYLHLIAVHATTTGGGPRAESAPIRIGTKAALAFTAKPKISGTRKVGRVLTAVASYAPSNASPKITYQWYRSGKKISKATKVTYKLTKKDRGKRITVKVTMSAYGYYGPISKTSSKTATVKR